MLEIRKEYIVLRWLEVNNLIDSLSSSMGCFSFMDGVVWD